MANQSSKGCNLQYPRLLQGHGLCFIGVSLYRLKSDPLASGILKAALSLGPKLTGWWAHGIRALAGLSSLETEQVLDDKSFPGKLKVLVLFRMSEKPDVLDYPECLQFIGWPFLPSPIW